MARTSTLGHRLDPAVEALSSGAPPKSNGGFTCVRNCAGPEDVGATITCLVTRSCWVPSSMAGWVVALARQVALPLDACQWSRRELAGHCGPVVSIHVPEQGTGVGWM